MFGLGLARPQRASQKMLGLNHRARPTPVSSRFAKRHFIRRIVVLRCTYQKSVMLLQDDMNSALSWDEVALASSSKPPNSA